MSDTIEIYTAEGWVEQAHPLDHDRILTYARQHGMLPLKTEADVRRAAEAAYGWDAPGGPWQGQRRIGTIANWRWFLSWSR